MVTPTLVGSPVIVSSSSSHAAASLVAETTRPSASMRTRPGPRRTAAADGWASSAARRPWATSGATRASHAFSAWVKGGESPERSNWPMPHIAPPSVNAVRSSDRNPVAAAYWRQRAERSGRPPVASCRSATATPRNGMSANLR